MNSKLFKGSVPARPSRASSMFCSNQLIAFIQDSSEKALGYLCIKFLIITLLLV